MLSNILQVIRDWALDRFRSLVTSKYKRGEPATLGIQLPDDSHPSPNPQDTQSEPTPEPPREPGMQPDSDPEEVSGSDVVTNDQEPEPPIIRGPRSHPVTKDSPPKPPVREPDAKPPFTVKPELMCGRPKGSILWHLMLAMPDDSQIEAVQQDGGPLWTSDDNRSIPSFRGSISVSDRLGDQVDVPLFNDKPLIFKMRSNWDGNGRRVKAITIGYFIVIVPSHWRRIGHPPVEHGNCLDAGFKAHYFHRNRDSQSNDEPDGFKEWPATLEDSKFMLAGNRIFDDSPRGDLFGGAVPKLLCPPDVVWAQVGSAERDGWPGRNFRPQKEGLVDILNGHQGGFYIRVYDQDNSLIDSGEFRFLENLHEIRINGKLYTDRMFIPPSPTGHTSTAVKFVRSGSAFVRPKLDVDSAHAEVQTDGTIVAAPDRQGDNIQCSLDSGTHSVSITLDLPRVWWQSERANGNTDNWHDQALTMSRREFRERASAGEAILIHMPRRIRSVSAGFGKELPATYSNERTGCKIPLDDFLDYPQIDQHLRHDAELNIRCDGSVLRIIHVAADPPLPVITAFIAEPSIATTGQPVTLSWATRNADCANASISPGIGPVKTNGSMLVSPIQTVAYTLRLTIPDVQAVTRSVTITINPRPPDPLPVITAFVAEPSVAIAGQPVTLSWATRNADCASASISPGIGPVKTNGSMHVNPSETATYVLRLTRPGMQAVTRSVTITISPPFSIESNPHAIVRRSGGGWRSGKGFSLGEFRAAGLHTAPGRNWTRSDKRRRSVHPANVETLRRWTNARSQ